MTPIKLRDAEAGDLDAIVAVFLACWRGTYRGIVPDAVIDEWTEDGARERWRGHLQAEDQSVVVAARGSEVVGVIRFGAQHSAPGAHGFLHSLYVDPGASRDGVGAELLHHAVRACAEAGVSDLRLWVFAGNAPAIRFYRTHGWRLDGCSRVEEQFGERELGMRRPLGPGHQMEAEMAAQPSVLERLIERRPILLQSLRAAVPEVLGVTLLARGSSDNAAVYGRYVLELALRRPVALAAPSLWTRYGLTQDLHGHVAVAVSQSGCTPEIASTLAALHDAGALTVAITNGRDSPMSKHADLTLELGAGVERSVPATKTFTAELAMFALLAEALGKPPWREHDWAPVPAAQEHALQDLQPALAAAEVLARTAASIQLGRGLLYPIALEAALKLTETSAVPAVGFSSADFLHGPIAAAGPRTSVVAYIAPGPVAEDVCQAAEAARIAGAPLVVVAEQSGLEATHVPVPAGIVEALSPLVYAVRAQQLAARTALLVGADPDQPRGLTKITATT